MPQKFSFHQVDVFTDEVLRGNPLAVVHGAALLTTAQMADLARWTNLSETVFLLPPTTADADYRLQIFTPGGELPFAGHPTLGACHAWLEAGGVPLRAERIVQECGIGLVSIRRDWSRLAFAAPPLRRSGPMEEADVARIADALGVGRADVVAHQWVDNGPGWCAVMLATPRQVLGLRPDFSGLDGMRLGVFAPYPPGDPVAFEVRVFVPGLGVREDPVTGSLQAALALWLMQAGLAPTRYVAAQGTALGRAGRVHVSREGTTTWIGGDTVTCVRGEIRL